MDNPADSVPLRSRIATDMAKQHISKQDAKRLEDLLLGYISTDRYYFGCNEDVDVYLRCCYC